MRSPMNSWSDLKIKSEHSHSAGIHATLGLNPNVQLDGALSRTSGEEKNETQWNVDTHYLPPDTKKGPHTVIWSFTPLNNYPGGNQPNEMLIKPTPVVLYALMGGRLQTPPILEVNILMHYSLQSSPQTIRAKLGKQPMLPANLPVYTNILHQASIMLDLGKVELYSCPPEDLNSKDREKFCSLGEEGLRPSPMVVKLKDCSRASECEVPLGRIFLGHVTSPHKSKFYLLPSFNSSDRLYSVRSFTSGLRVCQKRCPFC